MPQHSAKQGGTNLGALHDLCVARIPREELVAAIPGQRDSDALSRELRHEERGERRRISEWLVEGARDIFQETIGVRTDDQLGVVGAKRARDARRVRRFVERRVVETDRKICTGRLICRAISATTEDESIPPDKNAPNGTSDSR